MHEASGLQAEGVGLLGCGEGCRRFAPQQAQLAAEVVEVVFYCGAARP